MFVSLIVAMSENRVIGRDGALPWRLPDDLARFKRLTMGHAVIMGRTTYESIGRPLPGRRNVVLSRRGVAVPGTCVFVSLDKALGALAPEHDHAFVIGGQELYQAALPVADRIYLTLIHRTIAGDTFFPAISDGQFIEHARERVEHPLPHSFIVLDRV